MVHAQNKANEESAKATRKMEQQWNQMFAPINRGIDRMVDEMLRGNVRIGAIFRDLGISMLQPILSSLEKALEAQIEYSVTSGAIGKEHALAGILRDAAKAASNVYAEVPFPFNIPAAAGMFATVAALGGGLPSAAGGMETVPHDMLAMVHKNESILPADYARGLRGLIENGGGTGGNSISIQQGAVHAMDAQGVQDVLNKHSKHLVKLLHKELRRKNMF